MVEFMKMDLFKWKTAKTWSGRMASESKESGFIDEVHGQEACMVLQRHYIGIQAPETCPTVHSKDVIFFSSVLHVLSVGRDTGLPNLF